jgi:hypothetical protein
MKYCSVVDVVQWVWKTVWDIDKSKAQIRRDLVQGAIRLNDRKLKIDDVFILNDEEALVYDVKKTGLK